jgi:ubiquinone/menaquinone biosynthesis C-methylase UbiE
MSWLRKWTGIDVSDNRIQQAKDKFPDKPEWRDGVSSPLRGNP